MFSLIDCIGNQMLQRDTGQFLLEEVYTTSKSEFAALIEIMLQVYSSCLWQTNSTSKEKALHGAKT